MEKSASVIATAILAASLAAAQPLTPKSSADLYPSHTTFGKYSLGADYLVHTIPSPPGGLFAADYLVIETALFGPNFQIAHLRSEHFRLRINGTKTPLPPQSPGTVAASLKYSNYENQRSVVLSGGVGNADVIYGPRPTARFPGDPTVGRPVPQTVPEPEHPGTEEKAPPVPIEERIQLLSWPEGEDLPPVAGLLFFRFTGKTKSIKSLELLYDGPLGKAVIKLI
jgi:hypothetical protein